MAFGDFVIDNNVPHPLMDFTVIAEIPLHGNTLGNTHIKLMPGRVRNTKVDYTPKGLRISLMCPYNGTMSFSDCVWGYTTRGVLKRDIADAVEKWYDEYAATPHDMETLKVFALLQWAVAAKFMDIPNDTGYWVNVMYISSKSPADLLKDYVSFYRTNTESLFNLVEQNMLALQQTSILQYAEYCEIDTLPKILVQLKNFADSHNCAHLTECAYKVGETMNA